MGIIRYTLGAETVFMRIRIRPHDKKQQPVQVTDIGGIIAKLFASPMACYMDWKPNFRIICGSI
jgi:hypothetical protein